MTGTYIPLKAVSIYATMQALCVLWAGLLKTSYCIPFITDHHGLPDLGVGADHVADAIYTPGILQV